MADKFFKVDPSISFEKIFCPLCQSPTGPKSDCYKIESDMKMIQNKQTMLPVFSENCFFRQTNLWKIHVNYPISEPLFLRFEKCNGVCKLELIDQYSLNLGIGKLFDETEVKSNLAMTFKTFIKEMQALEGSMLDNIQISDEELPVGIIINGKKILAQNREEAENCKEISENIDNANLILKVSSKSKKSGK